MMSPAETKAFATPVVLTVVTGRLLCEIGRVYEILNWMSDDVLFTHQLPRVGREAKPAILALHPDLEAALEEESQVTTDNYETWRDAWIDRYGAEITVPRLSADQHERIDPHSELAEKITPTASSPSARRRGLHHDARPAQARAACPWPRQPGC